MLTVLSPLVFMLVTVTILMPAALAVLATLLLTLLMFNPPLPHPSVVFFESSLILGVLRRFLLLKLLPTPQKLSPVLFLLARVLLLLTSVLPLKTQTVLLTCVMTRVGVIGCARGRRPGS